jgi:hypothetical protein
VHADALAEERARRIPLTKPKEVVVAVNANFKTSGRLG